MGFLTPRGAYSRMFVSAVGFNWRLMRRKLHKEWRVVRLTGSLSAELKYIFAHVMEFLMLVGSAKRWIGFRDVFDYGG